MKRVMGVVVVLAACSTGAGIATTGADQAEPASTGQQTTTTTVPITTTVSATTGSPSVELGDFPEFPEETLSEQVAASLQVILDAAVDDGTVPGVIATVIVADSGNWSGAAGVDAEGSLLTSDSRLLTASVGKTVTAAEVLRLVDGAELDLDGLAAEQFPPEIAFFDANSATIRDLLGMRSGIPDPPGYVSLVDAGSTPAELLESIREPLFSAGSQISYANINYILLGMIIEHVTGVPFWEALHSGVLNRPGLDGLEYEVKDALAADGWRIESDSASLARWGYELYGRSVLSDATLREMTDFQDEWYGLGVVDFSRGTPGVAGGYGIPAIGHGGLEPANGVMLVAFPETDTVVAVQARIDSLPKVAALVGALRDAAQS